MEYKLKSVKIFNICCACIALSISGCATNQKARSEAKSQFTEADSSQVPDSWYYPLGSTGAVGESGRGGSDIVFDTLGAIDQFSDLPGTDIDRELDQGSKSGTGGAGGSGVGGSGPAETPPGWIQSGPDSLFSDSAKGLNYLEYEDFNSRG